MYFVYLLQSESNLNKLYIGYTNNLERRLTQHNTAASGFTSRFKPWKVINHEAYTDKSLAVERELQFKDHGNVMVRLKERLKLI